MAWVYEEVANDFILSEPDIFLIHPVFNTDLFTGMNTIEKVTIIDIPTSNFTNYHDFVESQSPPSAENLDMKKYI